MAQLNDLIVNGNTRFLNSAYGNLVGSASTALNAGTASYATNAGTASNVAWANTNHPATFPPSDHNHDYKLSANSSALNISAGISISAGNSNVTLSTAAKTILISTTDTKVLQSNTTTNNFRPITLGYQNNTNPTALSNTTTAQIYATSGLYYKPGDFSLYNQGNVNISGTVNIGLSNTAINGSTFGKCLNSTSAISLTYSDYSKSLWLGSYNYIGSNALNDRVLFGIANGSSGNLNMNNLFAIKGNSKIWIRSLDSNFASQFGGNTPAATKTMSAVSSRVLQTSPASCCVLYANAGILVGSTHASFSAGGNNLSYDEINNVVVASAKTAFAAGEANQATYATNAGTAQYAETATNAGTAISAGVSLTTQHYTPTVTNNVLIFG